MNEAPKENPGGGTPSPAPLLATDCGGGLIIPFRGKSPLGGEGCFVAPFASVIGDVILGDRASVWFSSVVRGDIAAIRIGADTNIQDHSVLHVGDDFPCIVGNRCVVGHRAILHGCRIADEVLIGMGAIILNGVVIGEGSVVAAGTLIPEGKIIPPRSLVMGSPGKVIRETAPEQLATTRHLAAKYSRIAAEYLALSAG